MASTMSPLKSTCAGTRTMALPRQALVSLPSALATALPFVLFKTIAFVPFVNVRTTFDSPPMSSRLRPSTVTRRGWPLRSAQRRKRLGIE